MGKHRVADNSSPSLGVISFLAYVGAHLKSYREAMWTSGPTFIRKSYHAGKEKKSVQMEQGERGNFRL